jgi:hypothetical protein
MAWMASVRIGFPSWRTGLFLFSSCLALIGALDRDAQKPFCYASAAVRVRCRADGGLAYRLAVQQAVGTLSTAPSQPLHGLVRGRLRRQAHMFDHSCTSFAWPGRRGGIASAVSFMAQPWTTVAWALGPRDRTTLPPSRDGDCPPTPDPASTSAVTDESPLLHVAGPL